jgi:TatD DNase family protein
MAVRWIDTHCHLDAAEFDGEQAAVHQRTRAAGVHCCVLPAVAVDNLHTVATLAARQGDAYALGIHPLYVPQAKGDALDCVAQALCDTAADPRRVAVGEIGLDFWVPALCTPAMRERQWVFYTAQLELAREQGLPVIVHVRQSGDLVLKGVRASGVSGGIVHAFNGSWQQAVALVDRGFCLGFGGALTFERALQLRRLVTQLPLDAIVLETDAPDMPPHWVYRTAAQRATGLPQGRNEPAELPRVAAVVAQLRGLPLDALAAATTANALRVLPALGAWLKQRAAQA